MGRTARQPAPRDAALSGRAVNRRAQCPARSTIATTSIGDSPESRSVRTSGARRIPVEERLPDQLRQAEFEGSAARWETGVGFRSRCLT